MLRNNKLNESRCKKIHLHLNEGWKKRDGGRYAVRRVEAKWRYYIFPMACKNLPDWFILQVARNSDINWRVFIFIIMSLFLRICRMAKGTLRLLATIRHEVSNGGQWENIKKSFQNFGEFLYILCLNAYWNKCGAIQRVVETTRITSVHSNRNSKFYRSEKKNKMHEYTPDMKR